MTQSLAGVTVGIVENRFSRELATLFARTGARVDAVPLFEERYPADLRPLDTFLETAALAPFDDVIFTTAVGFRFVRLRAEAIGLWNTLRASLRTSRLISRSPKVTAAYRAADLVPALQAQDGTTAGIQALLSGEDLRGHRVAVQLFNSEPLPLVKELQHAAESVHTVQPYIYAPVSDRSEIEAFVLRVVSAQVDVLAFTSAPQVRVLLEIAAAAGLKEALLRALKETTAVASIGSVTTDALLAFGIAPRIVPEVHKMGPLVAAIAASGITRKVTA